MLQHYHQLKVYCETNRLIVADFSLLLDRAYPAITLSSSQLQAFDAVYQQVIEELGHPWLIVHLKCRSGEQLKRIRARRRRPEQSIREEFLQALNHSIERQIADYAVSRPLEIDSEHREFAQSAAVAEDVRREIVAALAERKVAGAACGKGEE